ncbi:MAG: PDZ domain-containing protein [Acidobacteria bacterium]|nr:PDZ domain-containing protein [Acidobacteriota bacterium]
MSGCPNCRAYVCDGEMFCRACGFRLAGFQISTQNLSVPNISRVPVLLRASNESSNTASWQRHVLPIMGFILALAIGSSTVALLNNEPISNQSLPTISQTFESYANRSYERSYMGVYLIYEADESRGALIDRIVESSPAEYAGLLSGDRIMFVNGEEIFSPADVLSKLSTVTPGSPITMEVLRDNIELNISLNTVYRNQLQLDNICHHQGFLGVSSLETYKVKSSLCGASEPVAMGVEVGEVLTDSPAEEAGLQEGDIIESVNEFSVDSPGDLSRRIRANQSGDMVELKVLRDGEALTLTATLGSRR